jgi:diadenosine tetraphosphate (Ap4A) HIT family hydrolase
MNEYEENNVFAKIIRSELDCRKIYEDEHILCFEDNSKSAKIHWLFIPKTPHLCYHDFIANSSPEVISHFFQTIKKVAEENNLDKEGYKLVTNNGKKAGQSVMHFHMHLLSGDNLSHL